MEASQLVVLCPAVHGSSVPKSLETPTRLALERGCDPPPYWSRSIKRLYPCSAYSKPVNTRRAAVISCPLLPAAFTLWSLLLLFPSSNLDAMHFIFNFLVVSFNFKIHNLRFMTQYQKLKLRKLAYPTFSPNLFFLPHIVCVCVFPQPVMSM